MPIFFLVYDNSYSSPAKWYKVFVSCDSDELFWSNACLAELCRNQWMWWRFTTSLFLGFSNNWYGFVGNIYKHFQIDLFMEFHYDTFHVTLCMFFGNRYIFLWSALVDICCRELFNLNLVHLQEIFDYRNWSLDRIETFVEECKMVFKCIAISSFIVRKTIPRICYL